jgi:hypothetical protein
MAFRGEAQKLPDSSLNVDCEPDRVFLFGIIAAVDQCTVFLLSDTGSWGLSPPSPP